MEEERRRRTRVSVQFEVTVRIGQEAIKVETENISLNGMLCKADERLHQGEQGEMRIVLTPETVIVTQAKIVRSDPDGIAIAFADIEEDSFFHLKKLVQYNTEDADIIDRELRKSGF